MSDVPQLGEPVTLRDNSGLSYASRVEDIGDNTVTVARPADLRAAVEYNLGLHVELVWTEPSGIHVLPTELIATGADNNIRVWHLAVTGDGWTEQRRDYVRVPVSGRIAVAAVDRDPADAADSGAGTPLDAILVDISEVAVQCRANAPGSDPRIAVGRAVRCTFSVGGDDFDIGGTIIITRAGTSTHESRLVVRFDPSRPTADALRKHVFRIQLDRRREGQS